MPLRSQPSPRRRGAHLAPRPLFARLAGLVGLACLLPLLAGCEAPRGTPDPRWAPLEPAPAPLSPAGATRDLGAPTAAPTAPAAVLAATVEMGPQMRTRVYSHDIPSRSGPVPCWTYVTEGLELLGQQEVALSVRRAPGETAFPRAPIGALEDVQTFARQGKIVGAGNHSQFRAGTNFLRPDVGGLVYTRGQALAGVPTPSRFLTAIVLTRRELAVAEDLGHARVLTLLGNTQRQYPTTPWFDRERAELREVSEMGGSVLGRVQRYRLTRSAARIDRPPSGTHRLVFTVPRAEARAFVADMRSAGPDIGVAALGGLDPLADASLLWQPGRDSNVALSRDDSLTRIGGNFVLVTNLAKADDMNTMEDGFTIALTRATWAKVLDALDAGRPIDVPGEHLSLSVVLGD